MQISPRIQAYLERTHNGTDAPAPTESEPSNEQLLEDALTTLDGTKSGREVSQFIRSATASGDLKVVVMNDGDYYKLHPGTGGVYNRQSDTLTVPRISLLPAAEGATFLAHEGQHAMDDAERPNLIFDRLGGFAHGIPAALKGLLHLDNPITTWGDEFSRYDHETEVNGYTRQAQVAIELGEDQYGWNLGYGKGDTVVPPDELADKIEQHPLYAFSSGQRALTAAMPALGFTLLGTVAGSRLMKLSPQMAKWSENTRSLVAGGVSAAVIGTLLLQDTLSWKDRLADIRK